MTGSTAKIVPEINLDEFERRLRAAGAPAAGAEDPLAELTRLVNAVHADARRASRGPQSDAPPALPSVNEAPAVEPPPPPVPQSRAEPPQLRVAPNFGGGLRPAFTEPEAEYFEETPGLPPEPSDAVEAPPPPPRSRGWGFKVGGMIVVGVVLLAGAAALKHGVPGLPKAAPFIAADNAPTKVQPPNEANVQSTGDIAALLMKDFRDRNAGQNGQQRRAAGRPAHADPADSAPAAPAAAPTVVGATPIIDSASPVGAAPDTPVVPPAAASASVAPLFPVAKPVKTVSVRPDGTLIASADFDGAGCAVVRAGRRAHAADQACCARRRSDRRHARSRDAET